MTDRGSISRRYRLRNKIIIFLQRRLGLALGPMHLLTVAGRKSGRPRTTPVAPIRVNGHRYLTQAYPNSEWVKNARASGYAVLARGRRTEKVELVELPESERGSILREVPLQNPRGARAFIRNSLVESDSPDGFAAAASRCSVFRIDTSGF